jgi:hypothetical protein
MVASTGEPYGYAGDSPLDGSDPTGLFGWSDITRAAGSVWNNYGDDALTAVGAACKYDHPDCLHPKHQQIANILGNPYLPQPKYVGGAAAAGILSPLRGDPGYEPGGWPGNGVNERTIPSGKLGRAGKYGAAAVCAAILLGGYFGWGGGGENSNPDDPENKDKTSGRTPPNITPRP